MTTAHLRAVAPGPRHYREQLLTFTECGMINRQVWSQGTPTDMVTKGRYETTGRRNQWETPGICWDFSPGML